MGVGSKFLDSFKSLDMYGTGSQIGIRGTEKSNSVLGSIITLCALFASIYLTSESFGNMVNQTNPTITRETLFNIHKLQVDSSSLSISLAFFKPLNNNTPNLAISDKTNDYSYIQKFYNLNYTCYNCTGIKKKSVVIQNMTGCSLFCPMNTIFESLEVGDTFNNSIYPSPDFIVDIQEKSMLVNSSITKKTFQNINISSFSRSESNNILNLFQNYSFSFPDNFSATILDEDENNKTANVTFSLTIPINSRPAPPSSGGNNNSNQPSQNTNQTGSNPPKNTNQSGSNQSTQNTNQTGSNPPQNTNQSGSNNSNQPLPPKNRTNKMQRRNLQSTNPSNSVVTSDILPMILNLISQQNSFPKVLLLYSDCYVTKQKTSTVYYLESLDYMDLMTGNPISYYVYLQQTDIIRDKTILTSNLNTTTFFTIQSIVKNNLDTSSRSEASLTFKVFPQKNSITVKYVSLSDVLSVFGSYYSVFTLIASVVCKMFSPIVYEGDLVNSVFRFREGGGNSEFENFYDDIRIKKLNKKSVSFEIKDKAKNFQKNEQTDMKNLEEFISEFSLKVNQEQKPSLNKFNCITENKEEIIPVVKNIDQEIESKKNAERSQSCKELRKLNKKFTIGKKFEIGSLNLFCLLYIPCCLKSSTNKSDLLKRCVKIINQYAQIESIINCQMKVNFMKEMLLSKNQKFYLNQIFSGLPLDNLNYSNKLIDEFEVLIEPKKIIKKST